MNLVAAVNSDWGIGCGGAQSVVILEDRRHFKELTLGGVVIAGRRTFEEIGGPLPGRRNIVLTRNSGFKAGGVVAAQSIDKALVLVSGEDTDKVFVIGGGSVYSLFMPMCAYAYITKIYAAPPSDTFLANLDESPGWSLESSGETFESGGVRYSFNRYKNCAANKTDL